MAQTKPTIRRAVVVGINEYADKSRNLSGAVNDATEMHELLTKNGEFKSDSVLLTNENAKAERIRAAISDLFWKTEDKYEIALFYFAGHGLRDHMNYGYLMPHDADFKAPFIKGIRIQEELKDVFLRTRPDWHQTAILILDCCYSGIAARSGPGDAKDVESFHDALRLERSTGSGRFIWASAGADERAREQMQKHADGGPEHFHGVFSYNLIEALRAGAGGRHGQVWLIPLKTHLEGVFRKGDPNLVPRFSDAGSDTSGIWLIRDPQVYKNHVDRRSAQIVDMLAGKAPNDLMGAIDVTDELAIDRLVPTETIDQHLANIQAAFDEQRAEWSRLLRINKSRIYIETRDSPWHEIINKVIPKFEVNGIRELDAEQRGFIAQVLEYNVANDYQSIIQYIRTSDREGKVGVSRIGSRDVRGNPAAPEPGSAEHAG